MKNAQTTQYESSNVKLTFGERVNYAVAEFGYNSIYIWISAFMTIFFRITSASPRLPVRLCCWSSGCLMRSMTLLSVPSQTVHTPNLADISLG